MKRSKIFLVLAAIAVMILVFVSPVFSDDINYADSGRSSVSKMTLTQLRSLYNSIPGIDTLYSTEPIVSETVTGRQS